MPCFKKSVSPLCATLYKHSIKVNAVSFPCNYITYIKIQQQLLHSTFYMLINALTRFTPLTVGQPQGAFNMCSSCFNLYATNYTYD